MEPNTHNDALTESISNADLPGNENDARTPQPAPAPVSVESSGPQASDPPTIEDGRGPRPYDEASTMGRSDAPKVAPTPPAPNAELPDPTATGEAG